MWSLPILSPRALVERELEGVRREHDELTTALRRMRELSDGYSAPSWACTSYRRILSELRALEDDVLRHLNVENQVLFPRLAAA